MHLIKEKKKTCPQCNKDCPELIVNHPLDLKVCNALDKIAINADMKHYQNKEEK